jgi:polysaccharide export outer membrane protein
MLSSGRAKSSVVQKIGKNHLFFEPMRQAKMHDGRVWRLIQRILAAIAIFALMPLLFLLYPLVRLSSPGPFFYVQQRPGLNGVPFHAVKIRTMFVGADRDKNAARSVKSSDPNVTRIGRILRDIKFDELPQLYNVLRGEMELVGPRPIAVSFQEELENKIPGFSARLMVRPGLTSLPQVCVLESDDHDRVVEDWTRRFDMEKHYIRNKSAGYDCIIIGLTLAFLIRKLARLLRRRLASLVRSATALALVGVLLFLGGCASRIAIDAQNAAVATSANPANAVGDNLNEVSVTVKDLKTDAFRIEAVERNYRVGSGDVLKINIFGEIGMNDLSVRVDTDGRIQLPAVPSQRVSGMTLSEIQAALVEAYRDIFNDPWAMVTIEQYGSRPLYLLGEFNSPGVSYMEGPTSLLNAIGLAHGTGPKAYLRGARVLRDNAALPVDLSAVLKDGKLDQNIWLKSGDAIFVPSWEDLKVYVLGAVKNPGAIALVDGKISLIRALSQAGGPITPEADTSRVRIIRSVSALRGQVIDIDAAGILNGKAPDFDLTPDDIVFVAQTGFADWNDFVKQLLPTLNLVGAIVQPFMVL